MKLERQTKDKLGDLFELWYTKNEKEIEMDIWWETGLLPESSRFQEKAWDMFIQRIEELY